MSAFSQAGEMADTGRFACPPEIPLANGVGAWWAALCARVPDLSYAFVMGSTSGVARTVYCGRNCLARDRLEAAVWPLEGLAALGWQARPLTGERQRTATLWKRLAAALDRGQPVAWFLPNREGALYGYDAGTRELLARSVTADGANRLERLPPEALRGARGYALSRRRSPLGRRSLRDAGALAAWAATALRPPLPGGCAHHAAPAWAGVGLAAYELWADDLECAARQAHRATRGDMRRVLWWRDARRAAVAFLRERAGQQRTPCAVRLRRAADLFAQEAALWEGAGEGESGGAGEGVKGRRGEGARESGVERREAKAGDPTTQRPHDPTPAAHRPTPGLLRRAADLAEEATGYVLEAALIGLRVTPELRRTLLEPPDAPLSGGEQAEMIYLARAGARPFRQFAARRLAGSDHPQTVATLTQLLYDADGPTSETALWALEQIGPPGRAWLFADAFVNVPREGRTGGLPLQRALLFAVAHTGDARARRRVREALEQADARDAETAVMRAWADELPL